jgi:hypothetical protein
VRGRTSETKNISKVGAVEGVLNAFNAIANIYIKPNASPQTQQALMMKIQELSPPVENLAMQTYNILRGLVATNNRNNAITKYFMTVFKAYALYSLMTEMLRGQRVMVISREELTSYATKLLQGDSLLMDAFEQLQPRGAGLRRHHGRTRRDDDDDDDDDDQGGRPPPDKDDPQISAAPAATNTPPGHRTMVMRTGRRLDRSASPWRQVMGSSSSLQLAPSSAAPISLPPGATPLSFQDFRRSRVSPLQARIVGRVLVIFSKTARRSVARAF